MEQPVWIFFSTLSVLIGLGIIAYVVYIDNNENSIQTVKDDLDKLQSQCDFVCGTTKGNYLGIDVEFPSDTKIYTSDEKICIEYKEMLRCRRCACNLEKYELNLNTSLAKELRQTKYTCYFEKLKEDIKMECKA